MPANQEFVIKLSNGQYYQDTVGGIPRSTPQLEQAERFRSRLEALGQCTKGPASFYDRANIAHYSPQEHSGGSIPSPEAQKTQEEAAGARGGPSHDKP